MSRAHIPGFPRIGAARELKFALERYWRGEIDASALRRQANQICLQNWQWQRDAGLDFVTVGDFALYDHVLDTSLMIGAVPDRFRAERLLPQDADALLDISFRMARGRSRIGDRQETHACEMTKWFDTNYHYIVPELGRDQRFALTSTSLFDQVVLARDAGFAPKPVLLGPVSYLWLSKTGQAFDRLQLLSALLPVYAEILLRLRQLGVQWLQIDEPALVLDLPPEWRAAYEYAYNELSAGNPKLLLTTYFGGLRDNLRLAAELPVAGLHVDCVRAPEQLSPLLAALPSYKVLSVGIVDGRNVWRNDLAASLDCLREAYEQIGPRLWISTSCSLLHCPVDLQGETCLDDELKGWLAFARQKLDEVAVLAQAVAGNGAAVEASIEAGRQAASDRRQSPRVLNAAVREVQASIPPGADRRGSEYAQRAALQREKWQLPAWPTTTIGSFPQTGEIRKLRLQCRRGEITESAYHQAMREEIAQAITRQQNIGLDVLVHGEAERNDMVEYFAEALEGFAVTLNGWVQSYGSRCVKPPIIYGDVWRSAPITVTWSRYAQSLTDKPVKGMLTGPVTMLQWSFVRDDLPREQTCRQIALALRGEVLDLQQAGIGIIQIDEPALREGLPLPEAERADYLNWSVQAFRLATAAVADSTQIHTHMCYAEFNDIIEHIAALDADVITLETSRSRMELLRAFEQFDYPNEIGPGVYDIHAPRVPAVSEMVTLLAKAAQLIPADRLWINPDCGLKTRTWQEVEPALRNMVTAARQLRQAIAA